MKKKDEVAVFWFRRDLRIEDNAGLYHALKSGYPVLPLFVFDKDILDKLEDPYDRRVQFIHDSIRSIKQQLKAFGSDIFVKYGKTDQIWKEILEKFHVKEVYANHDYEQFGIKRDKKTGELLNSAGIPFYTYKDQVVFEKNEVLTNTGKPYSVFTPYARKWKENLTDFYLKSYRVGKYKKHFYKHSDFELPSLNEIGFMPAEHVPAPDAVRQVIIDYHLNRDYPAIKGTTHLGVHLRFGTVSIRQLVRMGLQLNEKWLSELIWRDFYMSICWHFPHINEGQPFKKEYENIQWRNKPEEFERWCAGETGFPLVDAGMRELNATGFMHNRVRMVTAGFLCKDLLIDWRWGETYFASKLLDFDFAANNGGWQWAAGSGCDAVPYFRVFNPDSQALKFDQYREYIKKWIPEIDTPDYPSPMIDHKMARERAISVYKKALQRFE